MGLQNQAGNGVCPGFLNIIHLAGRIKVKGPLRRAEDSQSSRGRERRSTSGEKLSRAPPLTKSIAFRPNGRHKSGLNRILIARSLRGRERIAEIRFHARQDSAGCLSPPFYFLFHRLRQSRVRAFSLKSLAATGSYNAFASVTINSGVKLWSRGRRRRFRWRGGRGGIPLLEEDVSILTPSLPAHSRVHNVTPVVRRGVMPSITQFYQDRRADTRDYRADR